MILQSLPFLAVEQSASITSEMISVNEARECLATGNDGWHWSHECHADLSGKARGEGRTRFLLLHQGSLESCMLLLLLPFLCLLLERHTSGCGHSHTAFYAVLTNILVEGESRKHGILR